MIWKELKRVIKNKAFIVLLFLMFANAIAILASKNEDGIDASAYRRLTSDLHDIPYEQLEQSIEQRWSY